MRNNWNELLKTLPESEQVRFTTLKQKAEEFQEIPTKKKDAIVITPEELEVAVMKLCLEADASRIVLISFEEFEGQFQYLKKRVVNPIRLWFPGVYAQMIDTVTGKSIKTCLLETAAARNGLIA